MELDAINKKPFIEVTPPIEKTEVIYPTPEETNVEEEDEVCCLKILYQHFREKKFFYQIFREINFFKSSLFLISYLFTI